MAKIKFQQGNNQVKTTGNQLNTPEAWEKEIRSVENKIGHPSTWSLNSHKLLQDKLNEYKNWRENTPEGKKVIDYHNKPNEYVVPLPSHLKKVKKTDTITFIKKYK